MPVCIVNDPYERHPERHPGQNFQPTRALLVGTDPFSARRTRQRDQIGARVWVYYRTALAEPI